MKSTGLIRKLDPLGRLVVPVNLRQTLGIEPGDPMEIYMEGNMIVLRKHQVGCSICGNDEGKMSFFYGKTICNLCVSEIGRSAERQKLLGGRHERVSSRTEASSI